jgi:hypothetical protein
VAGSPRSNRALCLCGLCRKSSHVWLPFNLNGLAAVNPINGKTGLRKRRLVKQDAAGNCRNEYEPWLFHLSGPFFRSVACDGNVDFQSRRISADNDGLSSWFPWGIKSPEHRHSRQG